MTRAYGDPVAGLTGAFALLAALHYRTRTGCGQFIDLSQVESLVPLSAEAIMDYTMNQRIQKPEGNRHRFMAPHGVYRCRGEDRWVAIAVANDAEWQALCRVLGEPSWTQEKRFSTPLGRWQNQEELDKLLECWTVEQEHREAMQLLQAAGVAAGALLTSDEIFSDPHLQARGFFHKVSHPEAGTHSYPGPSWKLSRTPSRIRFPAPCLGEHNRYVLQELLGLTAEEVARLEAEQIIGSEPLDEAVS